MRYLITAMAIVFMLSVSAMAAQEMVKSGPPAQQQTAPSPKPQGGLKEIVVDENEGRTPDRNYGVGEDRQMAPGQTHDENTGLPNVVESDKEGEL